MHSKRYLANWLKASSYLAHSSALAPIGGMGSRRHCAAYGRSVSFDVQAYLAMVMGERGVHDLDEISSPLPITPGYAIIRRA
jgi:hypothetical protein